MGNCVVVRRDGVDFAYFINADHAEMYINLMSGHFGHIGYVWTTQIVYRPELF